jgi:hypothetical protein
MLLWAGPGGGGGGGRCGGAGGVRGSGVREARKGANGAAPRSAALLRELGLGRGNHGSFEMKVLVFFFGDALDQDGAELVAPAGYVLGGQVQAGHRGLGAGDRDAA